MSHNHPLAHGNLNPTHLPKASTLIWSPKANLEREEKLHYERKRGESMREREVKRKKKGVWKWEEERECEIKKKKKKISLQSHEFGM